MSPREIKLTSKRQATFPAALCRELGVEPGDTILLERREVNGRTEWVLRRPDPDWSWAGSLRVHARGKCHDWKAIQASIERGRSGEPGA